MCIRDRLLSLTETDYTLESGGEAFESLMNAKQKPTAIICGNDVLAAGAIIKARQLKIDIPHQVSITGFDDISLATVVSPTLTTVRVPQLAMGKAAAELLLKLLEDETPASIELETEIIYRESLSQL